MPRPLAGCLLQLGMVWLAAGAALSEVGRANNPLPAVLLGGCTACWYGVAGYSMAAPAAHEEQQAGSAAVLPAGKVQQAGAALADELAAFPGECLVPA